MPIKKRNITDIGRLNKYITIQKMVSTPDGGGGVISNWVDWISLKAKMEDRPGSLALVLAGGSKGQDRVVFTVRYRNEIADIPRTRSIQTRILLNDKNGSRAYRVDGYNSVLNENRFIEITCNGFEWQDK